MRDKHFELLGKRAKDAVTGFEGVVTSLSFDLYGCIQIVITPPAENGKYKDGHWLDISRMEILSDTPVIDVPDFTQGYIAEGKKGASMKSLPN